MQSRKREDEGSRTAVVMLCVRSGALLSFAWYLRDVGDQLSCASHTNLHVRKLTNVTCSRLCSVANGILCA